MQYFDELVDYFLVNRDQKSKAGCSYLNLIFQVFKFYKFQ